MNQAIGLHPDQMKCSECEFWVEPKWVTRKGLGRCRRYPPSVVVGESSGIWPLTDEEDWCGEYRAKHPEHVSEL
jgi:hypothetical protein